MRLLHTSDWHIGKRFDETDLLPLQEDFCDWIVECVKTENIDVLLLAGDIFDRSMPKNDAIDLVDDVFNRISSTGTSIVAISGNHDSAAALNLGSRFMTDGGLHIRAERQTLSQIGAPVTVFNKSKDQSVQILPLPYIDPQRVHLPEGIPRHHEAALQLVIEHHKNDLVDISKTIVMSHAFVAGGMESESERPIAIGGTGLVSASVFDGFGYVALGHLHRPQSVGDRNIFYSGSPMSYSFSEEHQKSVRIIDVNDAMTSHTLDVGVGRKVVTLEDSLENLLNSAKYDIHSQSFVRVRLTDSNLQYGVVDRLRQKFPFIINAEQPSITQQGQLSLDDLTKTEQMTPEMIVEKYMQETFDDLDEFRKTLILNAVLAASKGGE